MPSSQTTVVGFVGVGDMGAPMARNLLRAGYRVVVTDVQTQRAQALESAGAECVADAQQVANEAEIVFACLNSVDAMHSVAVSVAKGSAVRVYADLSTSGPTIAKQLRNAFTGTQIDMLDAPISGQINRAEDATLAIMVSGPSAAFALARPVFEAIGKHVFYLGNIAGGGQMMKVANNLINNVQTLATSEAIAMAMKFGLEPAQMFEILNVSTGRNSQTDGQLRSAVLEQDFNKGAVISITKKDITLAVEEAARIGVAAPTANAAKDLIVQAYAAGDGTQRSASLFLHIAKLSDLDIKQAD
jgi:3-hydroxyisobutyrate dehydrogenase-like beta-hydroxyacid dehydrogenase